MHKLVIYIDFGGVGFTGKTRKAFFIDVDAEGFIGGDQNIDS
jgi:hypothetical protein